MSVATSGENKQRVLFSILNFKRQLVGRLVFIVRWFRKATVVEMTRLSVSDMVNA